MVTSRTSIAVPGTLEPNRTVTPSSGWTRMTSAFWPSSSVAVASNGRCGARLKTHRDLGDPAAQPLAGRR